MVVCRTTPEVTAIVAFKCTVQALDVACSIAALNLCCAHPMSRCVYNVVIVYLLTELHSGEFMHCYDRM